MGARSNRAVTILLLFLLPPIATGGPMKLAALRAEGFLWFASSQYRRTAWVVAELRASNEDAVLHPWCTIGRRARSASTGDHPGCSPLVMGAERKSPLTTKSAGF